MRHYELVTVLSPMLNQEQQSVAWERIKDFIANRSGEIVHEENWGTRRLAYAIKKGPYHFLEGSYHLTRFSTETPFNQELLTFLRLDEQVLRSLVTVTDPPRPAPPEPPPAAPAETAEQPAEAEAAEASPAAEEAAAEASAPTEDAPQASAAGQSPA